MTGYYQRYSCWVAVHGATAGYAGTAQVTAGVAVDEWERFPVPEPPYAFTRHYAAAFVPTYVTKHGFDLGRADWSMPFQSCWPLKFAGWACTAPATAAPYTNTFTRAGSSNAVPMEVHVLQDGTKQLVDDYLGAVVEEWHVKAGQHGPATQTVSYTTARQITGAGTATLGEPSAHTAPHYHWEHLGGTGGALTWTYAATAFPNQITDVDCWVKTTYAYYKADGSAHTNVCVITEQDAGLDVEYLVADTNATQPHEVMRVDPNAYAGDLDATITYHYDATHYVTFAFDKLLLHPATREIPAKAEGAAKFAVKQSLHVGGSLTVTEVGPVNHEST